MARMALDARIAGFAASFAAESGTVRIEPFLLIDVPAWRGRFGALLCETMGLVAWDAWNVILLAGDAASAATSGLPIHPGAIPALNVRVSETLQAIATELKADVADACPEGCLPDGPARVRCIEIEVRARDRLLESVAEWRIQVEALLGDLTD